MGTRDATDRIVSSGLPNPVCGGMLWRCSDVNRKENMGSGATNRLGQLDTLVLNRHGPHLLAKVVHVKLFRKVVTVIPAWSEKAKEEERKDRKKERKKKEKKKK